MAAKKEKIFPVGVIAKVWRDIEGYCVKKFDVPSIAEPGQSYLGRIPRSEFRIIGCSGKTEQVTFQLGSPESPTRSDASSMLRDLQGLAKFMTKYGPLEGTSRPSGELCRGRVAGKDGWRDAEYYQVAKKYELDETLAEYWFFGNFPLFEARVESYDRKGFLSGLGLKFASNANIVFRSSNEGTPLLIELNTLWELLMLQMYSEFGGDVLARSVVIRKCGYCDELMKVGGRLKGSKRIDAKYCNSKCAANARNQRKRVQANI